MKIIKEENKMFKINETIKKRNEGKYNKMEINRCINKKSTKLSIILMIMLIILNLSQASATSQTTTANDDKSNNDLQSLEVENYEISPEFNKNTTTYYISIPTSEKSVNITANAESESATVKITGNSNLNSKESTAKIAVTSANRKTKTYNLVISKQDDNNLKLSKLEIEGATLNPEFSEKKYYYKAEITQSGKIGKLNIKAESNNTEAKIEIIGNDDSLVNGENLITILLTNGEDTTTYQVLIDISVETTVVTKIENNDFIAKAKEYVVNFFSDTNKTIAFLIAVAVLLILLIIIFIVKINKNGKAEKNRESIKRRAK